MMGSAVVALSSSTLRLRRHHHRHKLSLVVRAFSLRSDGIATALLIHAASLFLYVCAIPIAALFGFTPT